MIFYFKKYSPCKLEYYALSRSKIDYGKRRRKQVGVRLHKENKLQIDKKGRGESTKCAPPLTLIALLLFQ